MVYDQGVPFHMCLAPMLILLLFQNLPSEGFTIASGANTRDNGDSLSQEIELPRGTRPVESQSYKPEIQQFPENQLDVDHVDDRTLRSLLLMELGSGTEHLLRTLFGDLDRKSSLISKRFGVQPRFNPGWKFIGLGKKRSFSPVLSGKPKEAVFAYQWNAPVENLDVTDPYLGALALSNLDKFFDTVKNEIHKNPDINGEAQTPDEVPSTGTGEPPINPRFRNKLSWFNGQPKTLYDPGWLMAGLGR